MNFGPQKFFIGLMGFFSILLAGALITFNESLEPMKGKGLTRHVTT